MRDLFSMEDGEDSLAGPSQHTYLAESSAEMSAERNRRLVTLTDKKAKRTVHQRAKRAKREQQKVQK